MIWRVTFCGGLAAMMVIGCAQEPDAGASFVPGGDGSRDLDDATLSCTIPQAWLINGGPGVDGIPALHNPPLVDPDDPKAAYLRDDDRVIGLLVNGQPLAVPLNIGWWHEIVNLDMGATRLAVTHCPLTGSSLTFSRSGAQFAVLGVSGLLFSNNLVMYDRGPEPSLWPQLSRGARCGPKSDTPLSMRASVEMTWEGWRSLYPDTRVVSDETGHSRDYQRYPYDVYTDPWSQPLFPMPGGTDIRRPPKERVLGIPFGDSSGVALPFGVLDSLGAVAAVQIAPGGQRLVVFWDRSRQAAMAYHRRASAGELTFQAASGAITDVETGSTWLVDGRAASGPLEGERLTPFAEAFVVYWFAWAAFHPDAELWLGGGQP